MLRFLADPLFDIPPAQGKSDFRLRLLCSPEVGPEAPPESLGWVHPEAGVYKAEFHKILTTAFGVEKIHSEYGMAELTSQAYSAGDGVFRAPEWMKVMVRDVNNPLMIHPAPARGAINIIDLMNITSCAFIATQDVGRTYADGSFSIDGRLSGADIRGCNLLVQ